MHTTKKPWRVFRQTSTAAATAALMAVLAACGSSSSASTTTGGLAANNSSAAAGSSVSSSASPAGAASSASASLDLSGVDLKISYQTADFPALLKASGLFSNTPYKYEVPVIAGPANQLAALYGKQIDVGEAGENTAAFEAANATTDWTKSGPPIQGFAVTWTPKSPYPSGVYVTKSSGITSLAGLKGKKIGYNYGGNIYAAYVIALAKAGFGPKDVHGVQFPSNQAAASAFDSGNLDAVVTGYSSVKKLVDSGKAIKIADNHTLGIIGGSGWIAQTAVLNNPTKLAAIKDFFGRLRKFYEQWIPTHEAAYEKVEETVLDQTPDVAKVNWENAQSSTFYRIGDPKFLQIQQETVDVAYKFGGLKNDVKSKLGFNYSTVLDGVTTG
jgi:sulfonate transport system substrate-binding protein